MKRKALILPVIAAGAALLAATLRGRHARVERGTLWHWPVSRKRWEPLTFRSTVRPSRATCG